MSKNVDLSSKEWCDLIFEGKNKDFGAYQMRKASIGRHNKAMLFLLLLLALIAGIMVSINVVNKAVEADINTQNEQQMVAVDLADKDKPEDEQTKVELEQPKALPEEILNTIKVTELAIVPDDQVKKEDEIKSVDELKASNTAFGQTDFDKGTDDRNVVREHKAEVIVEDKAEPEKVFTAVEQMPQFPGGDAELMKYLSSHINYPTMAMENNVQGRVIVQFVVTKSGSVGEVKVARGVDRDLDREAVRVVKSLPRFIPGKMNGQPVNVWYTLPVNFKLQGIN